MKTEIEEPQIENEEEQLPTVAYALGEDNVDEIFELLGDIRSTSFVPAFDDLENYGFPLDEKFASREDLPEEVSYLAADVQLVRNEIEGQPVTQVVLRAIPYMWPAANAELFDPTLNIVLGEVEDGQATPKVLLIVKNLNTALGATILVFEKL